ncbi:unnamed protein product, partial [Medioppia subpectinata]
MIGISTTSMSILESCLPLWLIENMKPTPKKWQLGTVFVPDSIAVSSLAVVGISCVAIPLASNILTTEMNMS